LTGRADFVAPQTAVTAGAIYSGLARLWIGAAALVSNALLARLLGPAGRGVYAALVLFASLGALLASVGLDHAAASLTAQRPSVARQAVRWGATAAAFVTLLLLAVGFAWIALGLPTPFGATRAAFIVASVAIPLGTAGLVYGGALRGLDQLRTWNVGLMLEPCVFVVGLAALLVTRSGTVAAALAVWLLAQLVRLGFFVYRTHRSLTAGAGGPEPALASFGLKIWITQIVGTLNTRLDYFILLAVAGAAELGQYATAVPLAEVMTLGAAAIASAVLPKFAVLDREAARKLAHRALRFATYSAVLIGGGLAVAVPLVSTAVFGRAFHGIVNPTLVLMPGFLLWSSVYITTAYFNGNVRRPFVNLWIALLATVIDVPLAYLLGARYGAVGAGIASTFSYGTAAIVNFVVFLRLSGSSFGNPVRGVVQDILFVHGLFRKALGRQGSASTR